MRVLNPVSCVPIRERAEDTNTVGKAIQRWQMLKKCSHKSRNWGLQKLAEAKGDPLLEASGGLQPCSYLDFIFLASRMKR